MGIPDIILLCCFIPGIVRGITKGFVEQATALIAVILGVWLAVRFSAIASVWLSKWIVWKPEIIRAASFVIIVVLTILVLFVIGRLITKVIKISTLGWLNRLLGVLLGVFTTALILGVCVTAIDAFNSHWVLIKPEVLDQSPVWCAMREFSSALFPVIKQLILTGNV